MTSATEAVLVPAVPLPSGRYAIFAAGTITDTAGRQLNGGAGASFEIVIPARFDVLVTPVGVIPSWPIGGEVTATFSAAYDPATVTPNILRGNPFILRTLAGVVVPTRYVVRAPNILALIPETALPPGDYLVEIAPTVTDTNKNPINNGQIASFPLNVGGKIGFV
jgi:hypothetical protein